MNKKKEAIVLIHGIWIKGIEFFYLRFKLRRQGYRVYQFRYSSLFKTPEQNADSLFHFIEKINQPVVHFVAHSLGGIIVAHLFKKYEIEKEGKVVMIASPINGSTVAHYLVKKKYLRYLLGKSIVKGLLGDGPDWEYKRQTCVFAGTRKIGMGLILARAVMQSQNDGTVNLLETRLEHADESYVTPLNHVALLFSGYVAEKILMFLKR